MSRRECWRKEKKKKVTFVSFVFNFLSLFIDMWIMYQVRVNIVLLQLLGEISNIFKTSRGRVILGETSKVFSFRYYPLFRWQIMTGPITLCKARSTWHVHNCKRQSTRHCPKFQSFLCDHISHRRQSNDNK